MAMGTRKHRERQAGLWYKAELPTGPGHPFYKRLNEVLDNAAFGTFCESNCAEFYHEKLVRASIACAWSLLPHHDDRLFRRTRQRTRDRMASGRFTDVAGVFVDWTGGEDSGSRYHLAHASAYRRRNASAHLHLGAGAAGTGGGSSKVKRSASIQRRWKPTQR